MALDLTAMRAEVVARGFDYLSNTRIDRFLNDAIAAINDLEPWVYLATTATGAAPLGIASLGRIESVTDVARLNTLTYMDRDSIVEAFADLTLTGVPEYYYLNGLDSISVFPVSASTVLTVRYYVASVDLSVGSDVPAMPDRFRYAIVDYAVAKALEDVSNYAEAQAARASGDATVARMREWNLLLSGSGGSQLITGASGDW